MNNEADRTLLHSLINVWLVTGLIPHNFHHVWSIWNTTMNGPLYIILLYCFECTCPCCFTIWFDSLWKAEMIYNYASLRFFMHNLMTLQWKFKKLDQKPSSPCKHVDNAHLMSTCTTGMFFSSIVLICLCHSNRFSFMFCIQLLQSVILMMLMYF